MSFTTLALVEHKWIPLCRGGGQQLTIRGCSGEGGWPFVRRRGGGVLGYPDSSVAPSPLSATLSGPFQHHGILAGAATLRML